MSVSRRDFLATSAAAAAAGIVGRPLFLHGWQGQGPAPQPVFTAIRRNVGYFSMRGGTIGFLVNPGAVVVVDSQFPAEATACLTGLNERSGGRGVDFLINSHHHGDHTGGIAELKAKHHCKVTAPRGEAAKIPAVDVQVGEGDKVTVGGLSAKVLETPGHTAGHISYWFEADKLVFVGLRVRHDFLCRALE